MFNIYVNLKLMNFGVIVSSPSCEVNLPRSCVTVVESGGDPTDQWVVTFEVL
jgi:hypothetical protein